MSKTKEDFQYQLYHPRRSMACNTLSLCKALWRGACVNMDNPVFAPLLAPSSRILTLTGTGTGRKLVVSRTCHVLQLDSLNPHKRSVFLLKFCERGQARCTSLRVHLWQSCLGSWHSADPGTAKTISPSASSKSQPRSGRVWKCGTPGERHVSLKMASSRVSFLRMGRLRPLN